MSQRVVFSEDSASGAQSEYGAAGGIGAKILGKLKKSKLAKLTIRNEHLAGKKHPVSGIPFDKHGFPDFSKVRIKKVKIKQTGNRALDEAAANKAAGLKQTPKGYTWHHHQDGTTMELVPTDIHQQTGHTGGVGLMK